MQVKVREHTRTLVRPVKEVADITNDDIDRAMLPFDLRKLTLGEVRLMLKLIRDDLKGVIT